MADQEEPLSPVEALMVEVAANMVAITENEMAQVLHPPQGRISEVGLYRALNGAKLKRKELDALQELLDETAYKTAAMIFALLDGKVEGQAVPVPSFTLHAGAGAERVAASLFDAFQDLWSDEEA